MYLDSNPHVQICSANLETQDTYWVADIDFGFANINRSVAAFRDKKHFHGVSDGTHYR